MPPIPEETLSIIHRLNRAYLHAARDGLRAGQASLIEALFGLDATLHTWLLSASPEAIERLATTPGTLFQARLPREATPVLTGLSEPPMQDVATAHLLLRHLVDGEPMAIAEPLV